MLAKAFKRTLAVVIGLRLDTHLVDGGEAVYQVFIYFWRVFFRYDKPERHIELGEKRVEIPRGIMIGDGGANRVVTLHLAPHVTHDVVGKVNSDGIWRRRQALDKIGHLFCAEIQGNTITLCLQLKAATKQDGGK